MKPWALKTIGLVARRHLVISALVLFLTLIIVTFIPVFYLEKYFRLEHSRKALHFVFQIVSGNWSSPSLSYSKRPFLISLSISFAIALNLMSFGLIAFVIDQLRKIRNNSMRNRQFDSYSDAILKASILREFPAEQRADVAAKLVRAFADGRKRLLADEYLEIPFPNEADRANVRARQDQDVIDKK
jgi:hypothetical protein